MQVSRFVRSPRSRSPRRAPPRLQGVALVGSSGGSTSRSFSVPQFAEQLAALGGCRLAALQLVESATPLDRADERTVAALWRLGPMAAASSHSQGALAPQMQTAQGSLKTVNAAAARADSDLAGAIDLGAIDALVMVSADPLGTNARALAAAIRHQLPVVGTGGASMGIAAEAGALVVEAGGSVGTSTLARSIALAAALARHWKKPYIPILPPPNVALLPLLDAALPAVLCAVLLRALPPTLPGILAGAGAAAPGALAVSVATLAARRAANIGDEGALAGAIAGGLTVGIGAASSAAAALAAGVCAGLGCRTLLRHALALGLPPPPPRSTPSAARAPSRAWAALRSRPMRRRPPTRRGSLSRRRLRWRHRRRRRSAPSRAPRRRCSRCEAATTPCSSRSS